jgi:hypothetical protein
VSCTVPSGVGASTARAERRLPGSDRQLDVDIGALDLEQRMRIERDLEVEVARRPAVAPGRALLGQAQLLSRADAARDVDVEPSLLEGDAAVGVSFGTRRTMLRSAPR